jgi:chemotaxis signal transduction protein
MEVNYGNSPQANHSGYETALGFRVGSMGFLIASTVRCEVIERLQVSPLPHVEPWFSGLLNIRGAIVPVLDLRSLLGETTTESKKSRLLAIDSGEKTMALWIDGYPELLNSVVQPLPSLPVLPALLQRHVTAAYRHNGASWLTVQFEEVFKTLGSRSHQFTTGAGAS